MSTVTPIIDHVEDLWPDEVPDGALDQLVLASHLLGANRAVSNFGGGNTSAKGVTTDHAGREQRVMWVKGSGSDLATMGPEHFTALRLDEVLPLMERDEMSDEDMVAYLARCQLDPAAPARVDRDAAARVRPGAARAPHAPGRDQRAGRHRRRRAARRTSASATRRCGFRTSGPASRSPSRSRSGPARVRAGRARQARPDRVGRHRRGGVPAHDRGDQSGGRVRQRARPVMSRASAGASSSRPDRWTNCCRRSAARCPPSARRS